MSARTKASDCVPDNPAMNSPENLPTFAPGLYDIGIEAYLAERRHVSASGLKRLLLSPLHLQRYLLRQHDSSPQLDFGTAAHCALLEPERFAREYFALPVQQVDLFHEADLSLIAQEKAHPVRFVTEAQMAAIDGIRAQVGKLPEIVRLLREGLAERTLFWRDEASGIRCKIRPDMLVLPDIILELKTTFDASLAVFQRTLLMQRYHLSAAMYREGVRHLTGRLPDYVYLVASRHPPFEVQTFVPSTGMLEAGEKLFREALAKISADTTLYARYS